MLDALQPYMLVAKLAGALLLLVGCFGYGAYWEHGRAEADIAKANASATHWEVAYNDLNAAQLQANADALTRQKAADEAVAKAKAHADAVDKQNAEMRRHLDNAYSLNKTCKDASKEIRDDLARAQVF